MAPTADAQAFIDLEVEAWEDGDQEKQGRGGAIGGARTKWRKLARGRNGGQLRINLGNAIREYLTASANVEQARTAHHAVTVPDEADVIAVTTYIQLLGVLIAERVNLDDCITTLIPIRSAQRSPHRTCTYLEIRQRGNQNLLTVNRATVQHYRDVLNLAREAARASRLTREELGQSWVGRFFVGSGAYSDPTNGGGVHAFLKQDHDGKIVDRVAVKDTEVTRWFTATSFDGPLEVAAMQRLRQLKDSSCIVRLRNWRAHSSLFSPPTPDMWIRIYMEYCSYGTLDTLRKGYTYSDDSFPPEPLLWAIFDSLVTAGLLMERGEVSEPVCDIWDPIIHGDLRLQNIMLGKNDSGVFSGYEAQAKVGDFGVSYILRDLVNGVLDDQLNRKNEGELTFGTANARPPEAKGPLRLPYEADGQPRLENIQRAPSPATNIWGIGFVMWSMIANREIDPRLQDYQYTSPEPNPDNNQEIDDANRAERDRPYTPRDLRKLLPKRPYSNELLDLITDCVQYEPTTRPSLDRVLKRIRRYTGGHGRAQAQDHAEGLRYAEKDYEGFRTSAVDFGDKWPLDGLLMDVSSEEDHENIGQIPSPPSESEADDDDDSSDNDGLDGNTGMNVMELVASRLRRSEEDEEDEDEGDEDEDEDDEEEDDGEEDDGEADDEEDDDEEDAGEDEGEADDDDASLDDGFRSGDTRIKETESSDDEQQNFSPSTPRRNLDVNNTEHNSQSSSDETFDANFEDLYDGSISRDKPPGSKRGLPSNDTDEDGENRRPSKKRRKVSQEECKVKWTRQDDRFNASHASHKHARAR